jgi:hypothetical protein
MATINIPPSVQQYFPEHIDPTQLWVNYNAEIDSLLIYLRVNLCRQYGKMWINTPMLAFLWMMKSVTGVMIEHFSHWLLVPGRADSMLQPA